MTVTSPREPLYSKRRCVPPKDKSPLRIASKGSPIASVQAIAAREFITLWQPFTFNAIRPFGSPCATRL